MNREVYNTILARRSIRKFTDKKVSREDICTLLEAGMAAPSACNLQPWSFVVVDEEKRLDALYDCADQGKYHAPLAIRLGSVSRLAGTRRKLFIGRHMIPVVSARCVR